MSNINTDISSVIFNIIKNIPPITYISCQQVNDSSYDVIEIENVLTKEECNQLINAAIQNGLSDRPVYNNGSLVLDISHCLSRSTSISNDHHLIEKIRRLSEQYTDISLINQERNIIVKYDIGNFFNDHYDAFHSIRKLSNGVVKQRKYTFIIYLNEEFEGGTTEFPLINKTIIPKTGKAIVYKDADSSNNIISQSMHRGSIVTNGTKWICTIFSY